MASRIRDEKFLLYRQKEHTRMGRIFDPLGEGQLEPEIVRVVRRFFRRAFYFPQTSFVPSSTWPVELPDHESLFELAEMELNSCAGELLGLWRLHGCFRKQLIGDNAAVLLSHLTDLDKVCRQLLESIDSLTSIVRGELRELKQLKRKLDPSPEELEDIRQRIQTIGCTVETKTRAQIMGLTDGACGKALSRSNNVEGPLLGCTHPEEHKQSKDLYNSMRLILWMTLGR
jgi:hypothetical protein